MTYKFRNSVEYKKKLNSEITKVHFYPGLLEKKNFSVHTYYRHGNLEEIKGRIKLL